MLMKVMQPLKQLTPLQIFLFFEKYPYMLHTGYNTVFRRQKRPAIASKNISTQERAAQEI
jgi:hypothetical protein